MNKILALVGYDGITTDHTYAVNDLPFVHDELLKNVAYNASTLDTIKEYWTRTAKNSLRIFESEVTRALSCNAKYSDMLLRLPEGRFRGAAGYALDAGQNITQTYDLSSVAQYGIFKPKGLIVYIRGNCHFRISVRLDYQSTFIGENIFSEDVLIETAADDNMSFRRFDLSSIEYERMIDSKSQDQLVIEIQALGKTTLLPQEFVSFEPGLGAVNDVFSVAGGFSQGFSDGFSMAKGLKLGTSLPLVSFAGSMIAFNVDEFISDNAYRLAYAFAHRIAARLLSDKLTGVRLNIFTVSDRENTGLQIEFIEKALKQHLKMIESTLLFNIQSTATPPIAMHGGGIDIASYVDNAYVDGNLSDEGSYPTTFL